MDRCELDRSGSVGGATVETFNHHMLTLAREARGLTQEELADALSLGQGTLSKYETGVYAAPREFAESAGGTLGYPADFFYQAGQPYGFPPFHYRKRKKLSKKALGRIVAEMNIRRIHIQKLSISFNLSSNRFIPEIDIEEYQGSTKKRPDVEDLSRSLRESWMLPDGPIPNMVDLLEENGGIVVPCDFGSDLIDAMSQRIDGMPVLFFVNTNVPADRLRHTLAHELAHMVLHTVTFKADDEMEKEADNFAGAFLMPKDEIRTHLRKFDLRHLANMKAYWKVSMSSIAMRAAYLQLITPYQQKNFFMEMNKLGLRRREPNEPPAEHPKMLGRMIEFHRRKLGYTDDDLSRLLCMNLGEFRATYAPTPAPSAQHLRLVN
jgi:Zn-dependent peptidase ImmA (M78 family)/transcriptional regulator with XRE-family HTH domain